MRTLLMCLLLTTVPVFAQRVFVWRNDAYAVLSVPEARGPVKCDYGIIKALEANNIDYQIDSYLPENLVQFDLVFVTLGFSLDCG